MTKPMIGISGNILNQYVENFHGHRVSYTINNFVETVEHFGGIPLILPVTKPEFAADYVSKVDALLFTGGYDISPHLYGEEPHLKLEEVSLERDAMDVALMKEAFKQNKPILAVCRGMQLMNVIFGGSLYQDLGDYDALSIQHLQRTSDLVVTHNIETTEGSLARELFGEKTLVNSFHHQAIKKLSAAFEATAMSPDGLVEAIEAKEADFAVGVQWHPEFIWQDHEGMARLFERFIEKAGK